MRATAIIYSLFFFGASNAAYSDTGTGTGTLNDGTPLNHFSLLAEYLDLDKDNNSSGAPLSLASQFTGPQLFPTLNSLKVLLGPATPSWRIPYQEMTDHFEGNFLILGRCPETHIGIPATLLQASKQVERIAKMTQEQLLSGLSNRDWYWIRKNAHKLEGIVRNQVSSTPLSRKETATFSQFKAKFDKASQESLKCSRITWHQLTNANWLKNLRTLLEDHPKAQKKTIMRVETTLGPIIFGGRADKHFYEKDTLFIASLGGNDFYGLESTLNFSGTPQLVIDFDGDDRYQSALPGGIAAGVGRISTLIDFKGNDHYLANSFSLGTGLLGYGLLIDLLGNDQYQSSIMSQGFGYYGNGQVIDLEGDDRYEVAGLGQGVGFSSGLGSLYDRNGNDTYIANGFAPSNYGTPGLFDAWSQGVGIGFRPKSPGGIGLLFDRSGEDRYIAGSFSQGGGYFYGHGSLIDSGAGNDFYLGSRYNLAWAAHTGLGFFYNEGGNDAYSSRQLAGAGAAWDKSIATFIDGGGDDQYSMGEFSYGSSAHHSLAVFIDMEGKDQYRNKSATENYKGAPNLSVIIQNALIKPTDGPGFVVNQCEQATSNLFVLNLDSHSIESLFEENIYSLIRRHCPNATKQKQI